MIFLTSCTLVISNYKGLYNANMDVRCPIGHFWQRYDREEKVLPVQKDHLDRRMEQLELLEINYF